MNPIEAQQICQSAEQALRHGSIHLHQFPGLLKRVIAERLWERRKVPGLGIVELGSLRDLVTAKPLRGWGEDPTKIEAVIRDDAEVLPLWREAMKGKPGRKSVDNITLSRTAKGTSRAYTLARLQRQAPDLFDQVKAGNLTAHRAAVQAGIRHEKTPLEQLQHWWRKASLTERLTFQREVETEMTELEHRYANAPHGHALPAGRD